MLCNSSNALKCYWEWELYRTVWNPLPSSISLFTSMHEYFLVCKCVFLKVDAKISTRVTPLRDIIYSPRLVVLYAASFPCACAYKRCMPCMHTCMPTCLYMFVGVKRVRTHSRVSWFGYLPSCRSPERCGSLYASAGTVLKASWHSQNSIFFLNIK